MKWTEEQHKAYYELVEWSHKVGREGAKKLLYNIGMPEGTYSFGTFCNVEEAVAFAIRRGAIRILNQINGGGDTGAF
jgi:hypothetical protein